MADGIASIVVRAGRYTTVANGRFNCGYITRRYRRPEEGVHAVQLELTQVSYMEEAPPFAYDEAKANAIEPLLRELVSAALAYATAAC